jgi:hypothetical protein
VSATEGVARLYHWLLENVDSASFVKGQWNDEALLDVDRAPVLRTNGNGAASTNSANGSTLPRSKRLMQSAEKN